MLVQVAAARSPCAPSDWCDGGGLGNFENRKTTQVQLRKWPKVSATAVVTTIAMAAPVGTTMAVAAAAVTDVVDLL